MCGSGKTELRRRNHFSFTSEFYTSQYTWGGGPLTARTGEGEIRVDRKEITGKPHPDTQTDLEGFFWQMRVRRRFLRMI